MSSGYSGTPLARKLGLSPLLNVAIIGLPDSVAAEIAADLPADAAIGLDGSGQRDLDYIQIFSTRSDDLLALAAQARNRMKATGMLWVSWPKKASRIETDITEDRLREWLLPTGLVDVKVCAVDAVWSGLKFVWRKELRAGLPD